MTLGEILQAISSYSGDDNLFKLPVMVHTPGMGDTMVDAELFLLANKETGEKCLHLDAAQPAAQAQAPQEQSNGNG